MNEGPWTLEEIMERLEKDPAHHHMIKTIGRDNLGRPVLACPCGWGYVSSGWPSQPIPQGMKVIDK